jgi:hypothetical protein
MIKTKEQILQEFEDNLKENYRLQEEVEKNIGKEKEYYEAIVNFFFASQGVSSPYLTYLMELSKIEKEEKKLLKKKKKIKFV